jgi:hypothetical protein
MAGRRKFSGNFENGIGLTDAALRYKFPKGREVSRTALFG